MYKWFLVSKYLRTKLVALFGIAAVTLCVAMVLVVTSVMGGFLDTIRSRSRGLHSELVLESGSMQGFPYYDEFAKKLKQALPDVVRVTSPAIHTAGIFRVPALQYTKLAKVLGIRIDEYVQFNDFKKGLHYEHYYPGTTTLAQQEMLVAGLDNKGNLQLPREWADANAKWRASETDKKTIADFDAHPPDGAPYPDIRPFRRTESVFAFDPDGPFEAGPKRFGAIVGTDLLFDRDQDGKFDRYIARGASVALSLLPLSASGNPLGEPPVLLPLRYVDDSHSGIYEIDSMSVYVDVDMLQHHLAMDPQELEDGSMSKPRVSQLLIALQPGVNLDDAKKRVQSAWIDFCADMADQVTENDAKNMHRAEVATWEDMQRGLINAVEKEKYLMLIILAIVCLVAIVLLGLIFYMIVEKKTRDIGVLKAVGARSRGIASMFIGYAAAVGFVGSILGNTIGAIFVRHINEFQDFLARLNPQLRVWSPDVYSFDRIPDVVKTNDIAWITTVAILASIAGSLIPALVAGRVWPVRALRYE
ncbi:MAG: ABC transporter permease [Planctomycetes bacterium]|nr:ABC transporter permease [Planctomycetota bacterium]MBI3833586.1 ABC transporter permease [Planctomycetota bacterium]